MNTVKAEISKEKASKKVSYTFEINNDVFKAHYLPGKIPSLVIMHNGSTLGIINEPKTKTEYAVNSETKPLKITAWIDNGISIATFIGKVRGVGIEVDGRPVQGTVTDPEIHIKNGRPGLYVLSFLLILKSVMTYYNTFNVHASHVVAGIVGAIYFVPFLFALIVTIKYKTWTTLAILTGIILSVLEMIDYVVGIPDIVRSGNAGVVIIWMIARISILYVLCNAFIWKRKQKESQLSMEQS